MQVGEISVGVTGDISSLKTVLNEAKSESERTANSINQKFNQVNPGAKMATGIQSMTKMLGGLGIAVSGAAASMAIIRFSVDAIRTGMEFEHTMKTVQAITQSTGEEFQKLNDTARKLGATTEFTATQAASGLKILGQAGLNAKQSMESLPGILDLATIGELSLAEATATAVAAVNAFRLPMSDIARVNDVVGKTAIATNADVRDIAEAFKYAAPAAAAFGYTLEETAAYIGLLANLGIKGSMAGTQLSMGFTKVDDVFKKAGMDGSGKKLIDALEVINQKSFTAGEVLDLFGERGGRAALGLQTLTGSYRDFTVELEKAGGTAEQMANIIRSSTLGSVKELMSAWEGFKIDVFARNQEVINDNIKDTTALIRFMKDPIVETTGLIGDGWKALGDADRWLAEKLSELQKKYDDFRRTQEAHWREQQIGIEKVNQSMVDYDNNLKNVLKSYKAMQEFGKQFEEVDDKLRESVGRWQQTIKSKPWLESVGLDPKTEQGLADIKKMIDETFGTDKEMAGKMKDYFTFRADAFGVSESAARKAYSEMIAKVKSSFPKEKQEELIKFVQSQFETKFDINFKPTVKATEIPRHEMMAMVKKWNEEIRSFREKEMGLETYELHLKYQEGDVEKLKKIREEAKKVYGDMGSDVSDYHRRASGRSEIGPYDKERTKATLKEIEEQWKEHDEGLQKLTADTFESMRESVSDVYFKVLEGDMKNFEDVYKSFMTSLKKITADYFSQMTISALFGKGGEGGGWLDEMAKSIGGGKKGGSGFSGIGDWFSGLFGGGAGKEGMSTTEALSKVRDNETSSAASAVEVSTESAVEEISKGISGAFDEAGNSVKEQLASGIKESLGTSMNVGIIYANSIVSTGVGEGGGGGGWLDAIMAGIGSYTGGSTETGMGTNTEFGGGSMTDYLGMVKHEGGSYGDPGSLKKPLQGIGPDEYMAILRKNEVVSTPEQLEAMGTSGPKSYFQVSNSILVQAPKGRITSESVNQLRSSISSEIALAQRRNG